MGLKREFILEGLDCANCASKIEARVAKLDGVGQASLNFVSKTLTMEIVKQEENETIIKNMQEIVNRLEPHVKVSELTGAAEAETDEEDEKGRLQWLKLGSGALLFSAGLLLHLPYWWEFTIYLAAYLIVGSNVLLSAGRNILRGQIFDENLLMSIATIGAFSIGQFPEGVAVMLFYLIGEIMQDKAVDRSRRSIRALMDIRPDYANLLLGDETTKISPDKVKIGDLILVKSGEKVPLDGKVVEGISMLDTSALTGESVPRPVSPGSMVLSGSINKSGLLTLQVTKTFGESTVNKILELVQNATSKKARTENFITKFAGIYTPIVVFSALALAVLPPLLIPGATFSEWVYRALIFLVISCPCALVVSIPLGFFGGIGAASHHGILVKGGNYLEALNNVSAVIFDKTGTLTKGVFKVTGVFPASGIEKQDLVCYAALAEAFSNHPIALSVIAAHDETCNEEVSKTDILSYNEIPGMGMKAETVKGFILAGNKRLMEVEEIDIPQVDVLGTVLYMALDRKFIGYIVISDEIKDDAAAAVHALKKLGVEKTVMLTGDSKDTAAKVASVVKVDQFFAQLLPHQKVEQLEALSNKKQKKGSIIFVGDGINDAPVLARADIGIAMGGVGSDAAIEAADIVIMTDEPSKIPEAIRIAKRTRRIVWQNIALAMVVKGIVLILGAGGLATMWEAVFADVGVALLAVLNALRVMQVPAVKED